MSPQKSVGGLSPPSEARYGVALFDGAISRNDNAPIEESDIRDMAYKAIIIDDICTSSSDPSPLRALLLRLLVTTNASPTSPAHRAAACNLLSNLLLQTSNFTDATVQDILWKDKLWTDSFQVFLTRFGDSKPKPMKQLLSTLMAILGRNDDKQCTQQARSWALATISTVVRDSTRHASPKAYLHALTVSLERGIFTVSDVATEVTNSIVATSDHPWAIEHLLSKLLPLAALDELGPTLASVITAVLQSSPPNSAPDLNPSAWLSPLLKSYSGNPVLQDAYRNYILPAFLGRDFERLKVVLRSLGFQEYFGAHDGKRAAMPVLDLGTSHENLMVACLLVGTSSGLVTVQDLAKTVSISSEKRLITMPLASISLMLRDDSKSFRTGALMLLVGSGTMTAPIQPPTFNMLIQNISTMFADTDADARSDLCGILQRLVDRLRASSCALLKQKSAHIEVHVRFFLHFVAFLNKELRPSASYQRHVCGLQVLKMLARSGIDPRVRIQYWSKSATAQQSFTFKMELLSEETKTLLIALLLDPFDDVRDLAMNVLQMIMHDEGGHAAEKLEHGTASPLGNNQNRLVQILEIAEKRAAQSGRADHADGVARVHALLFALATPMPLSTNSSWYLSQQTILQHLFDRCDQMLISLRANLSAAIHGLPFHATLISLRYVVDQIQVVDASSTTLQRGYTLATKVQETVVAVWEIVRPVLCDDAPEGYMPAEAEDSDLDLDTKDILSFSWRALKEVSLLQRASAITLTKSPGNPLLDEDKFLSHLNLCFTQLRDLRHRGAFSTVAQTFMISCMQYMRCFSSGEKSLRSFYENTITSINSLSTINTRRSAGLPAMLAGLLASTSDSSPLFSEAIGDLTKIASGPIVTENTDHQALPQVHALNCLREIFKHSRLGQRSEKYIPEALQLSGICLTSDLWGIRNSGLMLFRALIDRLLGASDANDEDAVITRSKDVLSRHPQMLELIFTLLDANLNNVVQTSAVEKVFPALQLLQRVSPPPTELSRLRIAVYSLTGCPHWLVRDKAARAMARLYQREEVLPALIDLAKEYRLRHNAEHGRLLTIKYLFRTLPLQDPEIRSAASEIVLNLCSEGLLSYGSDIIEATTLDVITEYVQRVPTQVAAVEVLTSMSDSKSVAHILEMRNNDALVQIPHSPVLVMALASLLPYDQESYSEMERITTLAKTDPDACVAMLEGFEAVASRPNSSPRVVNSIFQIVMGILQLGSQTIPRVLIAAMDVVHSCARTGRLVIPANIDVLSAMWFDKAMECGTTPLSQDRALIVSGIILDTGLQGVVNTSSELSQRLDFWLLQIRDAAEEDQPFDTRFAAATALEKVQQGLPFLRHDVNFANMVVDYAILVYDLTNDDDDEVRGVAAKVACRLFSSEVNHVKRLVPLAAGSQMLSQLVRQHVSSTYLASVAVARLISSSHHNRTSETVMELLRTQTTEENVLFAEEKQNLFIDPAREARVWSKLLMSLAPDAIGRSEMQKLQNWTIEGLIALDDTANALAGGPLGWSYKPDSFALGLRVIYSAQTLLHWQRTKRSLRLRSTELRDRLGQLLKTGQRCGLNVIWLEELEKILARDLFLGVQKVGRILRSASTGSA